MDSQQKCSTCRNQGQEALRREGQVTNYVFTMETTTRHFHPLQAVGTASHMICLGIPYPVMPAWEAPLLLPIWRPITFCPWRSCSSENPLRFCWAFLGRGKQMEQFHSVSKPSPRYTVRHVLSGATNKKDRPYAEPQSCQELWFCPGL